MRVVVDTNVVVSALLFSESTPGEAFRRVISKGTLLQSHLSIAELSAVLARPKFDRWLDSASRLQALADIEGASEIVDSLPEIQVCRDPMDDHLLALCLVGKADFLVTGDEDLLAVKSLEGTRIMTPAEFLEIADSL